MRDIKDRFSELCIDKSLTFNSRATSPFSRGGKGDGDFLRDSAVLEGLLAAVSEKLKGCGGAAIPPS